MGGYANVKTKVIIIYRESDYKAASIKTLVGILKTAKVKINFPLMYILLYTVIQVHTHLNPVIQLHKGGITEYTTNWVQSVSLNYYVIKNLVVKW